MFCGPKNPFLLRPHCCSGNFALAIASGARLSLFSGSIGLRSVFVDLGAEKLIAAERDAEKIAVEIKSFLSPSPIRDLENAWGQFFLYSRVLQQQEPDRVLYLAVNETVYQSIFAEEAGQLLLKEPGFHLVVFNSRTDVLAFHLLDIQEHTGYAVV